MEKEDLALSTRLYIVIYYHYFHVAIEEMYNLILYVNSNIYLRTKLERGCVNCKGAASGWNFGGSESAFN